MVYELETCQEQQAEVCLWKSAFYPVIQHYRALLGTSNTETVGECSNVALFISDRGGGGGGGLQPQKPNHTPKSQFWVLWVFCQNVQ